MPPVRMNASNITLDLPYTPLPPREGATPRHPRASRSTAHRLAPSILPPTFRGRGQAFTFTELILVLAIISVLSAIAVPRYSRSLDHYRLNLAARRIVADMDFARSRAVAASQSVTVQFQVAPANLLTIPGVTGMETAATGYITNFNNQPYGVAIASASFSSSPNVTFNGYGKPAAAGSVVVQLGSLSRTVTVNADTGEVKLQ